MPQDLYALHRFFADCSVHYEHVKYMIEHAETCILIYYNYASDSFDIYFIEYSLKQNQLNANAFIACAYAAYD